METSTSLGVANVEGMRTTAEPAFPHKLSRHTLDANECRSSRPHTYVAYLWMIDYR